MAANSAAPPGRVISPNRSSVTCPTATKSGAIMPGGGLRPPSGPPPRTIARAKPALESAIEPDGVQRVLGAARRPRIPRLGPLALVGDLLGVLRDGTGGDDLHGAAQLHHVADRRLEHARDRLGAGAARQLDPERERVLVAFAPDDDLIPGDAR